MIQFRSSAATIPVTDLDRATRFYRDTLGLREDESNGHELFRLDDGSKIELYPRPQPTRADHTVLTFEVDDLERAISDLEAGGVSFEDYDLPDLRTDERHIATMDGERAAWFKDTEGNILCLHEQG